MTTHLKGLIITALGVLFVVPDSLFVRLIDGDAASIAFWRGITAGSVILTGVLLFQGLRGIREVVKTGKHGLLYTFLIAITAPGFVFAVSLTSVANVVFILASMPVFAAIFSRIFLGEAISKRMVLTMAGVFAGLGVIAWGSGETHGAHWHGDLIALGVSASFAGAMTTAVAQPMAVWQVNWPLILVHGAFISVSTCLLTLGPRYLASAEVALLILLESVLAPLLVWAVVGEDPGPWALVGGVVVIGALFVSNLWALSHNRRLRNRPQPRTGPPV